MAGTQPVGPIDSSMRILLSRTSGGQLQLAVANSTSVTFQNAYKTSGQTLISNISDTNLLYFTVSGTTQDATFRVASPKAYGGDYLSGSSSGSLQLVKQPTSLRLSSTYGPPPLPYVLFAGAEYQLSAQSGTTLQTVVPIPTNVYIQEGNHSDMTASCASNNNTTAQQAVNLYFCSLKFGATPNAAFCQNVPQSGWTILRQCQDGINYLYCKASQQCGDTNCYGSCSTKQPCVQTNGNFACQSPSDNSSQWWIWVLVAVAVLIILAVIYYVLS